MYLIAIAAFLADTSAFLTAVAAAFSKSRFFPPNLSAHSLAAYFYSSVAWGFAYVFSLMWYALYASPVSYFADFDAFFAALAALAAILASLSAFLANLIAWSAVLCAFLTSFSADKDAFLAVEALFLAYLYGAFAYSFKNSFMHGQ